MYVHMFAGFLELVNNMLTSGMVPALFPDDEKEGIIGQVRTHVCTSNTTKCVWIGQLLFLSDVPSVLYILTWFSCIILCSVSEVCIYMRVCSINISKAHVQVCNKYNVHVRMSVLGS